MIEHASPISGIAAYKSDYVATAGYDNFLLLWNPKNKQCIAKAVHDHLANQCSFSSCGKYLVSSSSDYTARLWEIPTLKLLAVFADQRDDVEMTVINHQSKLVATASRDKFVRIYDLEGRLKHRLEGHTSDVISVEWLNNRNEVISSSDDGTVKRWNAETGELLENYDLDGVETDTIAISKEGIIYAGNDEGEIIIIGDPEKKYVKAHNAGIKRLAYNSERQALASLSYDRTLKIWQVTTDGSLELKASANLPQIVWPRSCTFIGDSQIVFGTFGTSYAVYNYKSSTWDLKSINPTSGLNAVTPYRDGNLAVGDAGIIFQDGNKLIELGSLCNFLTQFGATVVSGGQSGQIFDALSGKVLYQHRSPLNCGATFYKDGAIHLIVGTYTGEGLVFKQDSSRNVFFVDEIKLHKNAIKGIACSKDTIFSVCADTSAAFHSIDDFSCLKYVEQAHNKIANGCAFLPDNQFASISRDLHLRIWKEFEIEKIATPHTHSIKCIASSKEGHYLATASYNGRIAIYCVTSREWIIVERPTTAGISSLAFDSIKNQFLASSYDGKVYKISVPSES
ncbi:WD40 repeat domain-containing protein [Nostoc punctiforme FACHB-252]|uniref:WD40 repeat domain-containing protein n=1 Tax=Nostoc punctiforme FACHB-252 TaxID=1357509 RepID=A0ABR8H6R3_NOSPU|nr:WD40 repeat domain-containing protein [Nostoc punctiforme]MBD2611505.1 WD40 repeat domain-containing protein [Nostoc punctiforme FACHB-252]